MAIFAPLLLAANVIGTAASAGSRLALAGGTAISGVGRTLGAAASLASTATGIGSGLIKGVGKAVGVGADQSTSDDLGNKALPPGVKLNKNGVMVQAKGGKGGGQVLPGQFDDDGALMSMDDRLGSMEAPDRGDAGPVQQILDYVKNISANTARTAAGMTMLSTSMMQSNTQTEIDDEKTGEGNDGSGGGILSRAFGSVGKTLKAVGSSLGKSLKFITKGLAIGGALFLFINKREEIQEAVAGIFKYFHELFLKIKDSDDPIGDLMTEIKSQFKKMGDAMLTMFKTFYKENIEPMVDQMFNFLRVKVEDFVSTILGTNKQKSMTTSATALTSTSTNLQALVEENKKMGGSGNLGFMGRDILGNIETSGGDTESDALRKQITQAAKKRFSALVDYSRKSDYAVQWEGLPFIEPNMLSGGWDMLNSAGGELGLQNTLAIQAVMNTRPIISGVTMPMSFLDGLVLDDYLGIDRASMAESDIEGIRNNAAESSKIQWIQQNLIPSANIFGLQTTTERFDAPGMDYFPPNREEANVMLSDLKNASFETFGALLPDKEMQEKIANAMLTEGSIFTHDTHVQKLLTPVSKAFESGVSAPVIIDSSSNDNSIKKQGDSIQMAMGVHHSDQTAHAFHEWKYA